MIDRKELYKKYMEEVNRIAEAYDWKTHFGPEEIVGMIADIIDKDYKVEKRNANQDNEP